MPPQPQAETLSRSQMEQVIKGGGSVLYGGRLINKPEDLPSAVDVATNEDQRRKAREDLNKQIADAQSQLAQLDAAEPKAATAAETKAADKASAKAEDDADRAAHKHK